MSKVLDLSASDVMDYCAHQECGSEIVHGQIAVRHGHELFCSMGCMAKSIGAVTITAGDSNETVTERR
ncbi:hypothetical protein [Paenibacillus illinoisensis]|uniref:hypothetical protein n=1 Tax=Paenibacillus illinoisensis TaxID=59845 RepID=UPI000FD99C10|nr:hypothetical protein [Paenibacillus illinoisensis]